MSAVDTVQLSRADLDWHSNFIALLQHKGQEVKWTTRSANHTELDTVGLHIPKAAQNVLPRAAAQHVRTAAMYSCTCWAAAMNKMVRHCIINLSIP